MSQKHCLIEEFVSELSELKNTTLRNFLAVKSNKERFERD